VAKYFGSWMVAGVNTVISIETTETLNKVVIEEAAEAVVFSEGTITVSLTGDYTNLTLATLIATDTDVDVCTIVGQTTELDAAYWTEAEILMSAQPEQAQFALGTQLQVGDGEETETFTKIAKVTNIGGPSLSLDTGDTTDHDSVDGWEEVMATILRSGEVSLELSFLPGNAGHKGLISDMTNRVLRNFKIVFPDTDTTTWSFSGFVVGFDPSAPHDNKLEATVTIKPSGKPILT